MYQMNFQTKSQDMNFQRHHSEALGVIYGIKLRRLYNSIRVVRNYAKF